jgi:hypothetical protein
MPEIDMVGRFVEDKQARALENQTRKNEQSLLS